MVDELGNGSSGNIGVEIRPLEYTGLEEVRGFMYLKSNERLHQCLQLAKAKLALFSTDRLWIRCTSVRIL